MRVLVATVPAAGHVLPLISLAQEFSGRGHEVIWATGLDQCEQLDQLGIAARPVCPPIHVWFEELAARKAERVGDARTRRWIGPMLFGEIGARLMVGDLLACARAFSPQVVLFESRCYAAPAVARAIGALPLLRAVTTLLPPEVEVLVAEAVAPLWRDLGMEVPEYAGVFEGLTFSAFPASLDDSAPYGELTVHRLAPPPVATTQPAWFDEWLNGQGGRPVVYATLGTIHGANRDVLRAILEGVGGDDVAVMMTVGDAGDPESLGPLPPNARVERFVPQDAVLPSCTAVVSHGGSGTTLGALAHGLPHVMLPQGADQFINTERCEAAGLGRGLLPGSVTPAAVRAALHEVLGEPSIRENARRVQAEMLASMSTSDALELVERTVISLR
jgi:UDP:flavonoid glycosyltransferase YjiC (YdhE family)